MFVSIQSVHPRSLYLRELSKVFFKMLLNEKLNKVVDVYNANVAVFGIYNAILIVQNGKQSTFFDVISTRS